MRHAQFLVLLSGYCNASGSLRQAEAYLCAWGWPSGIRGLLVSIS